MRRALPAAAAIAAIILITVLSGFGPDPSAPRCEIPGQQRTTVVECEAR
ncbi:hypothetical protein [Amycolatopsis thermoflava]|nr:hypothetical protein [Amycolatopsis thermoflava]